MSGTSDVGNDDEMVPDFDPLIHIKGPEIDEIISEKIRRLRKLLAVDRNYNQQKDWCTDKTLLRFLVARQFDMKSTAEKLTSALEWRSSRIPLNGGFESLPGWQEKMSAESETGKIYIPGYDQWGVFRLMHIEVSSLP